MLEIVIINKLIKIMIIIKIIVMIMIMIRKNGNIYEIRKVKLDNKSKMIIFIKIEEYLIL